MMRGGARRAILIASRQLLEIRLARSQQTRKLFLIASFSAVSAPAPHLTNHDSRIGPPFLFDTNKPHKIIILTRAPLKTKEKRFSIRYKYASRGTGLPAAVGKFACLTQAGLCHTTSRVLFQPAAEDYGRVFADFAVVGAEGGEEMAVNIQLADNFLFDEHGNHDFRFGFELSLDHLFHHARCGFFRSSGGARRNIVLPALQQIGQQQPQVAFVGGVRETGVNVQHFRAYEFFDFDVEALHAFA